MYRGGVTFSINKSFGRLQLIPEPQGLRLFLYLRDGVESLALLHLDWYFRSTLTVFCGLQLAPPLGVESPRKRILQSERERAVDTLSKLYPTSPRTAGQLTVEETCGSVS